VIIVINDNGRSYAPTSGRLAERLAGLRLRPGYERMLGTVKTKLPRVPVVGPPLYETLHGMKRGMKDLLAPQGMFEDFGLKYVGPVDGHDLVAVETALRQARQFDGPVVVHCVTRKGYGYRPAEDDEADQMHGPGAFDPITGQLLSSGGRRWTGVFGDELAAIGAQRADVVAITAAMCEPVGLKRFADLFPQRFYDVGIAEQHAMTSAAGLASGGLHPVVAIYATFLNRAFDQLIMDVALHRLPVTVVLDRAGLTGDDGPSHNGIWDMALLGVIPGIRIAAPRDEPTLRAELREAIDHADGPTVLRYPKTPLGDDLPAVRRIGGVDVLSEPSPDSDVDVLVIAIGGLAATVLEAVHSVRSAGFTVRVVDPRWITPVDPALLDLARLAQLVVTVEDGVVEGGAGARTTQALRAADIDVATREIGVPTRFLAHGKVKDVQASVGLTALDIGRRIVEWSARVQGGADQGGSVHAEDRADLDRTGATDESRQRGD
jgi:1-deoxy-D-xylulose-5-phosphate synthase